MRRIHIDASGWVSILDFYDSIISALQAPDWHGRNINALIDSMIGGEINGVDPPYVIVISGTSSIDRTIVDHIVTVKEFLAETREQVREEWGNHVDALIEIAS